MNLLDGMVAIEHDRKSVVGGLFNEVPDRISDTFTLVGVGLLVKNYPHGMDLTYLAIILSVTTAYIRTLGASLNCGHHFLGPMAKQHRMALTSMGCVIGIWYIPIFYYILMVMNVGLVITCYRRLAKVAYFITRPFNRIKNNTSVDKIFRFDLFDKPDLLTGHRFNLWYTDIRHNIVLHCW